MKKKPVAQKKKIVIFCEEQFWHILFFSWKNDMKTLHNHGFNKEITYKLWHDHIIEYYVK